MIYLVGETIDKARAHYQAETGKIVQLMRGIYADATDDIDETVLRFSIRIAHYLYPKAYLSAASASMLAPTRDGRLYLTGPRSQRTRIRALEIIQNAAPDHPSTATALINDGLGEFRVAVSSMRQRYLEAFRIRSEHAASLDDSMRTSIAERLIEEYGDPKKAADAIWALARENEWYREGEQAERFLKKAPDMIEIRNEAALEFIVSWHHQQIGFLRHDGFEWRWSAGKKFDLPLIQQRVPGQLPPFILSLLPEGWLERVLKESDERAMLRSGKRYISNIIITDQSADLDELPDDILVSRLADYSQDGIFTGTYGGLERGDIEKSFEENLARLYASPDTPRLSGVQIKAPMFLGEQGELLSATGLPFTHILKPAGTSGFHALPIIEYLAMALGHHSGFEAPQIALTAMPDDMPPALIVERFDIRTAPDDKRCIALEDLCSVLDLPPSAKYDGTVERMAKAIRPLSTSPEEDMLIIIRRALFAWLIADGDMHLKNLALLKVAQPAARTFETVRMAPLYDAVTTQVFPTIEHDRMALKINGKDNRLRRADFIKAAATAGLSAGDTNKAIDDLLGKFEEGLGVASLPDMAGIDDGLKVRAKKMLDICAERLARFS